MHPETGVCHFCYYDDKKYSIGSCKLINRSWKLYVKCIYDDEKKYASFIKHFGNPCP